MNAFEKEFSILLPETARLLEQGNFWIHPAVERVVLHGSRGLVQSFRPDSDLDLSLLVDTGELPIGPQLEALMCHVLEVTLEHWQGSIELDLAAVFDTRACGLICFERQAFNEMGCLCGGVDCFGLYKTGKGFSGFVIGAGVEVRKMVPCLVIWRK